MKANDKFMTKIRKGAEIVTDTVKRCGGNHFLGVKCYRCEAIIKRKQDKI